MEAVAALPSAMSLGDLLERMRADHDGYYDLVAPPRPGRAGRVLLVTFS